MERAALMFGCWVGLALILTFLFWRSVRPRETLAEWYERSVRNERASRASDSSEVLPGTVPSSGVSQRCLRQRCMQELLQRNLDG